jgi:hypothetical protein
MRRKQVQQVLAPGEAAHFFARLASTAQPIWAIPSDFSFHWVGYDGMPQAKPFHRGQIQNMLQCNK